MSNEIQVRSGLIIKSGNLDYQSQPQLFRANFIGTRGPTPGAILVSSGGTEISLSQLTRRGGMCRLMNLDQALTIQVGIYVTSLGRFVPYQDILPGESYVIRMSENIGEEYTDTGTGTTGNIDLFWAKVDGPHGTPPAILLAEAFDK